MLQYPGITLSGIPVATTISGYPDTQCIVVYNESPYFLNVNLVGSGNYSLAAFTADCFEVLPGFTGGIMYNPTQYISTLQAPASIAFVQAYGVNESLTRLIKNNQPTGYPIALGRLQNLGNGSILATASSVSNENNASGTLVYDSGDTAFNKLVQLFNDGSVLWYVDQSGIKHQVFSINNTGNPLKLGQAGDTTEVVGNIQVDGTFNNALTGTVLNGGTSGTATAYMDFIGEIKRCLIILNNFKTGASQQQLIFPTPFSIGFKFAIGATGVSGTNSAINFLNGVTQQSGVVFATPSTSGDAGSTLSGFFSGQWGQIYAPVDRIQFAASTTTAHNAFIELIGQ